jgi:hypothetical protein
MENCIQIVLQGIDLYRILKSDCIEACYLLLLLIFIGPHSKRIKFSFDIMLLMFAKEREY